MKNISKLNIISLLCTIVCFVTGYYFIKLDVLPLKFLIPIIIVIIVFLVGGIFLLNRNNKVCKIIGVILLIIMTIGNVFGIYHMNNIDNFFNKSFSSVNTQKIRYYVLALSKNNYHEDDISGEIGYYENSINVKNALKKLSKKHNIEELNFSDINNMFNKLRDEDIKFLLIEKTNYNIINEFDENFESDNYNVVYEFDVLKKITTGKKNVGNSFNIYVGGTDYVGLMDFNTIITVNMDTHKILLTGMPRDTYIDVYGYGYKNKLSFITEGIDVSKNSLARFFDIDIDYYIKIDAESVTKLIDEIGGITYCSDFDYTSSCEIYENGVKKNYSYHIRKGCQTLNGNQAIAASRNRNSLPGRDHMRQKNMQKIVVATLEKLGSSETITNYEEIINALADSYQTDIPRKLITKNIKDIINNGNKWKIETYSIDGEDQIGTVHRFDYISDWMMIPNMDTVNEAKKKINEVLG